MRAPVLFAALLALAAPAAAQEPLGPGQPTTAGATRTTPITVAGGRIHQAVGFGNTFLVTTPAGHVVIDTSSAPNAARHREMLKAVAPGPVAAIILTHGHGDHTGGVGLWREPGTKVIAQANYAEFIHYQHRLQGFFRVRNAAQYARTTAPSEARGGANPGNFAGKVEADVLFEKAHTLKLADLTFHAVAAPGETPDHLYVWVPELKAAFVGDNFYGSFPNMYTLRGTQTRHALEYVASLEKVLALKPEILLPSHGTPIVGWPAIEAALVKYRDAILYVHDATVKGMNEGQDVFTLMKTVKLPPELDVGEGYGAVSWSVRGIYEGYAGWFDGNPATMYAVPPAEAYAELGRLAGGPGPIAARAEALAATNPALALRLTDAALAEDPKHRGALTARRRALQVLLDRSKNSNESGWLRSGIAQAEAALK